MHSWRSWSFMIIHDMSWHVLWKWNRGDRASICFCASAAAACFAWASRDAATLASLQHATNSCFQFQLENSRVSLQFLFRISADWSKPIPSSLNVRLRQEFLEAWVLLEVEIADITGRQDLLELSSAFLMSCVSRIFSASFAFSASSRKTQGLKSLS